MTHILSTHPTTRPWSLRLPAGALTAARFVLHFGEMVLAMMAGMLVYMPVAGFIPAGLQQIGMALFMAAPMIAWMRIGGHGWRHGFEMALAMLVPWAAVAGVVALGAANVLPWLAHASDPAMYLGMLGIMLVRRDHYAHGGAHPRPSEHSATQSKPRLTPRSAHGLHLRAVLLGLAYFIAIVLVPLTVSMFSIGSKWTSQAGPAQPPSFAAPLPALPVPDPSKMIAVVLSSAYGAEITDTLPNFEILADSGAFNVYSVAPGRTVLPLVSQSFKATSLDFIPHFSYAEYESQIGRDPDLIVIPGIPWYTPERDAAMVDWIRAHAGPRTTVLGICVGGIILADTGLLDSHTATTNTGVFADLASKHPGTTWVPNVRWFDDGTMVESTTLTSGIDATLHVVDRFAGRAKALDVARQIGYTNTAYLDDPSWPWPSQQWPTPSPLDDRIGTLITTGVFRGQQNLGVPLFDGVSEAGLAGLLDPTTGSLNFRSFVMAPERTVVRSLNGFQFVPRDDFSTVPTLDRVLVPAGANSDAKRQVVAAWSSNQSRRPVDDIFQNVGKGETAYEATFEDLARTQGSSFARADASLLFYVIDATRLTGADSSVQDVLAPLLLSLLGAAAVYGATHLKFSRPRRDSTAIA
jgi:putative intracellular protease/amidase